MARVGVPLYLFQDEMERLIDEDLQMTFSLHPVTAFVVHTAIAMALDRDDLPEDNRRLLIRTMGKIRDEFGRHSEIVEKAIRDAGW